MADEVLIARRSEVTNNGGSDFGHSERSSQPGLELKFNNIFFSIKDKKILHDVSGTAHPGKVLAVMGPSGSGKTTLLNILGGRIKSQCNAMIGGHQLTKRSRRKISYVLQQDIFFPNLTLYQTLMFSAELRLPESMPTRTKHEIVSELIEQLDMRSCKETIIGDSLNRGLSGGEKKRANIANELLTDPAVLLLDEPTSGLDSSTAYALTLSLKKYAVGSGKTVLMTIHQPSIQMFFQFDTVLLLSGGRVAYYGSPPDVLQHFAEMGYNCDAAHYNPADFILDVVKSGSGATHRLISASNERRTTQPDCPVLPTTIKSDAVDHQVRPGLNGVVVSVDDDDDRKSVDPSQVNLTELAPASGNGHVINNGSSLSQVRCKSAKSQISARESSDFTASVNSLENTDKSGANRWPTSFVKQLKVLTVRSFLQGKYRYLSKLKLIKILGVALICGLVWWQIGRGEVPEAVVVDITASLFFITVFNSFNSLFDVLVIFPSEREVINKERMSGSYRLSAYYIAKTFSELPLAIVLPSLSTIIFYWMAGLNGYSNVLSFFGTWLVMIVQTLAAQSLGMFVSTATMDFEHGLVLAIFLMISYMLLGGFYVKNLPSWLHWLRYISPFLYSWTLMLQLEFMSDHRVICDPELSVFASCQPSDVNVTSPSSSSVTSSSNVTTKRYVLASDILRTNGADTLWWLCVLALFATLVVFRLIGYILLRLFHKPIVK